MELVKDGKLLGRDGSSWAKILGFYAVYYTFLACLIYFTVTQYSESMIQPGGVAPKIVTRVDMPGAAAYPFTALGSSVDGDGSCMSLGTDVNKRKAFDYVKGMNMFLESYKENADVAQECLNESDVLSKTCQITNFVNMQDNKLLIENSIKAKEPIFTFAVNKIYNWKPINNQGQEGVEPFVKNSIQAKCFEVSVDGVAVKESQFKVELQEIEGQKYQNYLDPNFFPYLSNDKKSADQAVPYNKGFFVGQIKPDTPDAWNLGTDQNGNKEVFKYFQCRLYAQNIEIPELGAEATNTEGMGYVQFALNYEDDEDAKC
jgi:hypothetical protein